MRRSKTSSIDDYIPLISEDAREDWQPLPTVSQPRHARTVSILSAILSILAISVSFCLLGLSFMTNMFPRTLNGLTILTPYPNKDQADILLASKKSPKMWFSGRIVNVNSNEPSRVKTPGSHVVISGTDSTFFHWVTNLSPTASCYIEAVVSNASALAAGGKTSYVSTGNISALEVWNVTALPKSGITWDTRPQRLNLLGTLNFTEDYLRSYDTGWQLRDPTPSGCWLEFETVFSDPPLSIDLQELR
ncbi:hypothetical protein BDP27DRAFT_1338555 [Rhodocollybia butyracea]|uniref:Ubiquitin 3 binding protein But2 C-terminal domain-containing protein n=1 Tax=Rhodocollybia butyracea TaxID=206335 RepID=A0A9P5PA50_9AGAR|nr:hypothetical protein BDP27DRAFT_1338555 [Rhodocollybia butyracea]